MGQRTRTEGREHGIWGRRRRARTGCREQGHSIMGTGQGERTESGDRGQGERTESGDRGQEIEGRRERRPNLTACVARCTDLLSRNTT